MSMKVHSRHRAKKGVIRDRNDACSPSFYALCPSSDFVEWIPSRNVSKVKVLMKLFRSLFTRCREVNTQKNAGIDINSK